jgi:hypothetical protein
MKKIALLLLIVFSTIVISSCTNIGNCSSYGEKQRYQKNPKSWEHHQKGNVRFFN